MAHALSPAGFTVMFSAAAAADEEEKSKLLDDFLGREFPEFFGRCEKLVGQSGGPFVNGEEVSVAPVMWVTFLTAVVLQMTYADVAVADLVIRLRDPDDDAFGKVGREEQRKEITEKYELIGPLVKKVLENQGIQDYMANLKQKKKQQQANGN